ncbi:MAG: methyltransferase domain-containing protein [Bacteroidetes bacterium]|nr:methyltransferase domain-containing protein [Bacteroidota bacterium]
MNDPEKSYALHEQHFDQYGKGGARAAIARSWFEPGSIAYAQARQRDAISDPLLQHYPGAQWLTVGDGRYGGDAHYLQSKGAKVLATDISDTLLIEGFELGYIQAYQKANAEALEFGDNSFDFVLCKESYHHFPRPMKALYEMLRVAKTGVVLLEPVDPYIYRNMIQAMFRAGIAGINRLGLFKLLLGRSINRATYEEVGNYVYKISRREIEKTALGLNYPAIAFKGINIFHLNGSEKVDAHKFSFKKALVSVMTGALNLLSFLRIAEPQLLSVIIFKEMPDEACIATLKQQGYSVQRLSRNPYW